MMTTATIRWFALAVLAATTAAGTALQARQPQTPSFEVTSVKANRTGDRSSRFQLLPGGRFVATNTTARALLQSAYRFEYLPFQVIGGPSWLDSERFDVEGRAGGSPSPADVDAMVRALLVTRFKMTYAKETRDMPVYHLTRARADGRSGPQLRPSTTACDRTPPATNTPPDPNALPRCGGRFARGTLGQRILGVGATLDELAQLLPQRVRRKVVNRTGLQGAYDFELDFTPDDPPPADVAADKAVPLFTALQEQLGLRLESARGPVDVLVIQSAERPEEN